MSNNLFKEQFREYYKKGEGRLFKTFEVVIDAYKNEYSIYWGAPEIIFDEKTRKNKLPLAITIISRKQSDPNPRIYLHEKLDRSNEVFELVVCHEIGHLWLHDVVGINNPNTYTTMNESDSEMWADYFSYCYLLRNRKNYSMESFKSQLQKATVLQMSLYGIKPTKAILEYWFDKPKQFEVFENEIRNKKEIGDKSIMHMDMAIERTLLSIGDIFLE